MRLSVSSRAASASCPHLLVANALLGHGAKVSLEIAEAESTQHVDAEIEREINFFRHLVGTAEVVGIILGEAAYAHQAVQYARTFITIDRALFGKAQRQIAIGTQLALVNVQVEGAIHGFQVVMLPVNIDWRVHIIFVESQVAAGLP